MSAEREGRCVQTETFVASPPDDLMCTLCYEPMIHSHGKNLGFSLLPKNADGVMIRREQIMP